MTQIQTRQLPLVAKIAIVLTFYNTWVLFEELVIDRHGLWKYLRFYTVGTFCAWDVAALAVLASLLFSARVSGLLKAAAGACPLERCAVCS